MKRMKKKRIRHTVTRKNKEEEEYDRRERTSTKFTNLIGVAEEHPGFFYLRSEERQNSSHGSKGMLLPRRRGCYKC